MPKKINHQRKIDTVIGKDDLKDEIFVKIRSTGKLIKSKIKIYDKSIHVDLLEDEYGISPGQACVFYKGDSHGSKLLGGGWIIKS